MTLRIIIGAVAFVCAVACAITSTFVVFEMVDRINERLPQEQQFAHLGWYWAKYKRLATEYKRLYPDGRLLQKYRATVAVGFACGIILVWCLRILAH